MNSEDLKPQCRHDANDLAFIEWHDDADRRAKSGERQRRCPHCERWIWESLWRKVEP